MSDRDDLAAVIGAAEQSIGIGLELDDAERLAEAILAAGWLPPGRARSRAVPTASDRRRALVDLLAARLYPGQTMTMIEVAADDLMAAGWHLADPDRDAKAAAWDAHGDQRWIGAVIPSRRTDPDTSRAAEPTPVRAGTQRAHLLAAFGLEAAVDGLTDEEAADLTQRAVPYRSEFAKRCSELRAAGLIADTGETRPGVAGHQRMVSAITDAGRATLAGLS